MKTQSPTKKRPLWCGPGGHGHGQDDRQQLGHGQVLGRAVDKAQQAVAAVGLGHVREQKSAAASVLTVSVWSVPCLVLWCGYIWQSLIWAEPFSTAPARASSQTCSMSRAHV